MPIPALLLEITTGSAILLACAGWLVALHLSHRLRGGSKDSLPASAPAHDPAPQQAIMHEQESTLLADTIPGMALILGPLGQILACNAQTRAHYGARLPALLRHPAARKALQAALHASPSGKDGLPAICEATIRLDVPTRQTIRLALRRMPGTTGRDRNVLVLLDDRSSIEATERMRTDFLAHASHELRTPLASLSGFIDLLKRNDESTADDQSLYLDIMRQQATRMQRLIDRLLYLSQLQLRGHARPRTRLEVEELFAIVTGEVTPRFNQADRRLEVTCEDELTILADKDEMVQVFLNLVENAIRYASQAGETLRIRLSARHATQENDPTMTEDGILLAVEDNGPGIAAHHLPRLTERFYRVQDGLGDSQTTGEGDTGEGTGLGLSIVHQILERHNGRLRFVSTPGQGTSCLIWLPVAPALQY